MSDANPLWGAPRIHGELRKLGIALSQSTVAKYMVSRVRPPSQTWRTFLANHVEVTDHPTSAWTSQQLRNAFPTRSARPTYCTIAMASLDFRSRFSSTKERDDFGLFTLAPAAQGRDRQLEWSTRAVYDTAADLSVGHHAVTGTHQGEIMGAKPTGKKITVHGIDMMRIGGGKVVEASTSAPECRACDRHDLLQASVIVLELLQSPHLTELETSITCLLAVIGLLRDPARAIESGNLPSARPP